MRKIQAKQETSLKWQPVQSSQLPPNHVVKCVMKLNPATGKMEGKTLVIERAIRCPDGKHAQVFFAPPPNITLGGVVTVWESGYLFIEHWPDLGAMLAPQAPGGTAAVWDAKTLSWKGWLTAYSTVIKGGASAATPAASAEQIGGMMTLAEATAMEIPAGCSRITPIQVTPFKARPMMSADLKPEERDSFDMGEAIIGVVSAGPAGHVLVTLPGTAKIKGRNTWFLFKQHIKIETPGGLSATTPGAKITDAEIAEAAALIGVEARAMKTVMMVEASGGGFLPSGKPKILFEALYFSDFTKGKYDQSHPDISTPTWNPDKYVGGEGEWNRMEQAMKLDRSYAIQSASYGLGQVMGSHSQEMPSLGYVGQVERWLTDNQQSEGMQLKIMAKFIADNPAMLAALKSKSWAKFASMYNGESYAVNQYDIKLADAYAELA